MAKRKWATTKPDDAKFIMSHNLNLAELAKRLAVNIPDQFLQELEHDLDEELRSIRLYEDTLSTLEELKNWDSDWHYAQI
jgi:hypothetical protein